MGQKKNPRQKSLSAKRRGTHSSVTARPISSALNTDTSASARAVARKTLRTDMTIADFRCVGFPDRLTTFLEYVDTINLAGGVPSPNPQVFSLNSVYDPDQTNTGHQPLGYDQLVAIYNKYLVTEVYYKLEFANNATAPLKVVFLASETDISGRSVDILAETKFAKTFLIGRVDAGSNIHTCEGQYKIPSIMGQQWLDPDSTMYANYNASPSDGCFFIIKCASLDGTANANLYIRVKLVYKVTFKDRNEPSASLVARKPVTESLVCAKSCARCTCSNRNL